LHWKGLNTLEYQALSKRSLASMNEVQPLTKIENNRPRLEGITDVQPKA
jgi:carnitine operon protein CaiE